MTENEAEAIYSAGREAVVASLLDFSRRLQALEEHIALNRHLNDTNWNIWLLESAQKGDFAEVVRSLIHGADVNCQSAGGVTPLMWAVCYGHREICQYLLSKGASVDAKDNKGKDALWIARAFDRPEIEADLLGVK